MYFFIIITAKDNIIKWSTCTCRWWAMGTSCRSSCSS